MAYGDVGGSCPELIVTCQLPTVDNYTVTWPFNICPGDPVALVDNYTVSNQGTGLPLFGQAMVIPIKSGETVYVRVRGLCKWPADRIACGVERPTFKAGLRCTLYLEGGTVAVHGHTCAGCPATVFRIWDDGSVTFIL